jgi:flavin reductase (DIM6/NTAB) family NADH-FMN oxidoreductase RutF
MKAMLKKFEPGEDRFANVAHTRSEETGCVILDDAVSVLECTVTDRMDAGDHYIVYGTVKRGQVLNSGGLSAVHHRKSGTSY